VIWIGIDPGKDTGIVVRDRDRLLWWTVVEGDKPTENEILTDHTIEAVIDAVGDAHAEAALYDDTVTPRIAVEGVVRPNPFHKGKKAFVDPFAVAVPALILGAVRALSIAGNDLVDITVVVPPGGHGSQWLATYPPELVTKAERRLGLNRPAGDSATIRHARSGWDVAGAATAVRRIELARVSAR
jgi:hypothetical protein